MRELIWGDDVFFGGMMQPCMHGWLACMAAQKKTNARYGPVVRTGTLMKDERHT